MRPRTRQVVELNLQWFEVTEIRKMIANPPPPSPEAPKSLPVDNGIG